MILFESDLETHTYVHKPRTSDYRGPCINLVFLWNSMNCLFKKWKWTVPEISWNSWPQTKHISFPIAQNSSFWPPSLSVLWWFWKNRCNGWNRPFLIHSEPKLTIPFGNWLEKRCNGWLKCGFCKKLLL